MLGGWWSGGYQNDRQGTGDGPIFLYENITIKNKLYSWHIVLITDKVKSCPNSPSAGLHFSKSTLVIILDRSHPVHRSVRDLISTITCWD